MQYWNLSYDFFDFAPQSHNAFLEKKKQPSHRSNIS